MELSISKKEIFDEVEKRSSLEGTVIPERFEGVWASEEEGKFLDSFWLEGYTAVIQLLKRYLTSETVTYTLNDYSQNEVLTIKADMPQRYNSLLDGSVATDVKMLIVCNVLHGWLEVKAPEVSGKYDEEAKGYAEDLRVKVLYRSEPTGKLSSADADGDVIEREGLALSSADADNVALKPKDWGGSYAVRPIENEVNIYPSHEYIGEKCTCDEIPMRQGWNCGCK